MSDADHAYFFVARQPQARVCAFLVRRTLRPDVAEPDDRYIAALLKWLAEAIGCRKDADKAFGCLACGHVFSATMPDTFMFTEALPEPGKGCAQPDAIWVTGICADCAKKSDRELIEYAVTLLGGDPKECRPRLVEEQPKPARIDLSQEAIRVWLWATPPSRDRLH